MSHYTTLNEHTRTQDFFFSVTDSLAVVCHFSLNWIFFLLFEFLSLANYSGLVIFLFTFFPPLLLVDGFFNRSQIWRNNTSVFVGM